MAGLKVIGNWLKDCGWVEAIVEAKIASAGTADSFLKVSHITRARHAHRVSASSLHVVLKKSYTQYTASFESGSQPEEFEKWCGRQKQESPHFKFWYAALHLELLVLIFFTDSRFPTLYRMPYTACTMVLLFGPYKLCKVVACPHTRHG